MERIIDHTQLGPLHHWQDIKTFGKRLWIPVSLYVSIVLPVASGMVKGWKPYSKKHQTLQIHNSFKIGPVEIQAVIIVLICKWAETLCSWARTVEALVPTQIVHQNMCLLKNRAANPQDSWLTRESFWLKQCMLLLKQNLMGVLINMTQRNLSCRTRKGALSSAMDLFTSYLLSQVVIENTVRACSCERHCRRC